MSKVKITIIGLGQMGRALAAGLRTVIKEADIVGHDKDLSVSRKAEQDKLVDRGAINLFSAMDGAALVAFAVPQPELETLLALIDKDVPAQALIFDISASKLRALKAAEALPIDTPYISSSVVFDPTTRGTDAAKPRSFKNATWVITPRMSASPDSVSQFSSIVSALDARPVFMDAAEHDGLRMAVNEVPQALGAALFGALTQDSAWRERQWLAGDALHSVTDTLGSAQPAAVAALLMGQKDATRHWLNMTMLQLMALRDTVDAGDEAALTKLLSLPVDARAKWLADWSRGRDTGAQPINVPKPGLMHSLLGDKLAESLKSRRPRL